MCEQWGVWEGRAERKGCANPRGAQRERGTNWKSVQKETYKIRRGARGGKGRTKRNKQKVRKVKSGEQSETESETKPGAQNNASSGGEPRAARNKTTRGEKKKARQKRERSTTPRAKQPPGAKQPAAAPPPPPRPCVTPRCCWGGWGCSPLPWPGSGLQGCETPPPALHGVLGGTEVVNVEQHRVCAARRAP